MGSISLYINEENIEAFNKEINKSELFNRLLQDYYGQDIDFLTSKTHGLKAELKATESKISVLKEKSESKTVKMLEERKRINEQHKEKEVKMKQDILFLLEKHQLSKYLYYDLRRAIISEMVNANSYVGLLKEKYGTINSPTKEFKKFLKFIKATPHFNKNYGWVKE